MIKYIHGSEDSIDVDADYVFEKMPAFQLCQEFCSDKVENRNIIVVKNGIVTECFKGTPDEINNGLYYTYKLHKQEYPLLVNKLVKRDILIKDIRALRGIFSYLSKTQYRTEIKQGLKQGLKSRSNILKNIDGNSINGFNKNFSDKDVFKVYAFQIGQSLGLHDGFELYTKKTISEKYPELRKYLYREDAPLDDLILYINKFVDMLEQYNISESGTLITFKDLNKTINIKTEKYEVNN